MLKAHQVQLVIVVGDIHVRATGIVCARAAKALVSSSRLDR